MKAEICGLASQLQVRRGRMAAYLGVVVLCVVLGGVALEMWAAASAVHPFQGELDVQRMEEHLLMMEVSAPCGDVAPSHTCLLGVSAGCSSLQDIGAAVSRGDDIEARRLTVMMRQREESPPDPVLIRLISTVCIVLTETAMVPAETA
jgi:hypothetical protein